MKQDTNLQVISLNFSFLSTTARSTGQRVSPEASRINIMVKFHVFLLIYPAMSNYVEYHIMIYHIPLAKTQEMDFRYNQKHRSQN